MPYQKKEMEINMINLVQNQEDGIVFKSRYGGLTMKAYFVNSNNVEDLKTALGSMIEYVKFLEEDTGRSGVNAHSDTILKENNIRFSVEEA